MRPTVEWMFETHFFFSKSDKQLKFHNLSHDWLEFYETLYWNDTAWCEDRFKVKNQCFLTCAWYAIDLLTFGIMKHLHFHWRQKRVTCVSFPPGIYHDLSPTCFSHAPHFIWSAFIPAVRILLCPWRPLLQSRENVTSSSSETQSNSPPALLHYLIVICKRT